MPHRQHHRGMHPEDPILFDESKIPSLREALTDFAWLLTRGYPETATLKLVGDRYRLTSRQQLAILRSACPQQLLETRLASQVPCKQLSGQTIAIDGFNLLITIEVALSGGLIFEGIDTCFRDLAGIHGSYNRVTETPKALLLIGQTLEMAGIREAVWYLDQPVSNSGRLRQWISQTAANHHWPWTVNICSNPDKELIKTDSVVASADSQILNGAGRWCNLARFIIETHLPDTRVIRLA